MDVLLFATLLPTVILAGALFHSRRIIRELRRANDANAPPEIGNDAAWSLLESCPTGLGILGSDGGFAYTNQSFRDSFGQARTTRSTIDLDNLLGGTDAKQALLDRLEREGALRKVDMDWIAADGRAARGRLTVHPICYKDANTRAFWFDDLTEQREAQEELGRAEARLRIALDHLPGGIRLVDAERRYVFFNDRYSELYGFPPDLLKVGDSLRVENLFQARRGDLGPGDPEELTDAWLESLPVRVEPQNWERETPRGRVLQVRTAPTPDGGVVNIVTDITERKQAERDLEEARRRAEQQADLLRLTLENVGDGILVMDENQDLLLWNNLAAELTGTPVEMLKQGASREERRAYQIEQLNLDPEAVRTIDAFDQRVRAGARDITASYIRPGIHDKDTRIQVTLRALPDGKTVRIYRDVTDDIKNQRAANLLKQAINNFIDALTLFDRDERIVFTNRRYHEIYPDALPQDQIVGNTMEAMLLRSVEVGQVTTPLARTDPKAWLEKILTRRRSQNFSLAETRHANGRIYEVRHWRTDEGGLMIMQRDITERKQIEEDLEQARAEADRQTELLRLTLENIDQGFSVRDIGNKVLLFNNRLAELLGTPREFYERSASREEFVAHHMAAGTHTDLPTDLRDEIEDWMERAGRGEKVERLAFERKGPNDTWLWCVLNQMPDRKQVRSFTDITRQKRAEQAAEEARRTAEQANQAKSEFLSSMSHELRTPLNAIIGFTEHVIDDDLEPLGPEQRDCLLQVLNAGQHLLSLINDVLDLTRIETGTIALSAEPVSVTLVVDECLSLTTSMAEPRGISVSNATDPDTKLVVKVDRIRLKQVLLNFLSNAVKYNRDGGAIAVETTKVAGTHARISVRDTGAGIPEEMLPRAFDPFDRLGAETSETEGTGIGLTICRNLTEQMGGTIGVESAPGEGSTFWVMFPLSTDEHAQTTDDDSRRLASTPELRGKILCVEDNPINMDLVRKILGRHGAVTMLGATTAEEGLEIARVDPPDAILMDINLPGINGYKALAQLAAMPETKHIPVIAVTAAATREDVRRGRLAGFFEYITKPIKGRDLVDTIARALSQAQQSDRATELGAGAPRVVVVDDVAVNLRIARGQLEKLGLECDTVSNPVEGLELLESGRYVAGLIDIEMPGLGGFALADQLRAASTAPGRDTPLYALTAGMGDIEIREYMAAGFDDVFPKPVSLDDLAVALRRWVTVAPEATTRSRTPSETPVLDLTPILQAFDTVNADAIAMLRGSLGSGVTMVHELLDELDNLPLTDMADRAHAARGLFYTFGMGRVGARLSTIEKGLNSAAQLSEQRDPVLGDLADATAAIEALRPE